MSVLDTCVAAIVVAAEALGPANVEVDQVGAPLRFGDTEVIRLDVLIRYLDPDLDRVERRHAVVDCRIDRDGNVSVDQTR